MSYSLFGQENNFTEMLFGKSESEIIKERADNSSGATSSTPSCDSGNSSETIDFATNFFLLKVLDSLLEVHDPRVIRLPTHIPPPPVAAAHPRHNSHSPSTYFTVAPPMNYSIPLPSDTSCVSPSFTPVPMIPTAQLMSIHPPPVQYSQLQWNSQPFY